MLSASFIIQGRMGARKAWYFFSAHSNPSTIVCRVQKISINWCRELTQQLRLRYWQLGSLRKRLFLAIWDYLRGRIHTRVSLCYPNFSNPYPGFYFAWCAIPPTRVSQNWKSPIPEWSQLGLALKLPANPQKFKKIFLEGEAGPFFIDYIALVRRYGRVASFSNLTH